MTQIASVAAVKYELRSIVEDEVSEFRQAISLGFGGDANPAGHDRFLRMMPLERTVAVFEGDEIVGTLGDFPLVLTVPGGSQLSMSGMTMVGVRATHTRQGILRSMVRKHLDNAVERGDFIAGLWASESGIYERFGFGLSVEFHHTKIDARRLACPVIAPGLDLVKIKPEQLQDVVAPFWGRLASVRAGFIDRDEERWQDIANDHEYTREGASSSRHIVARRDDEVVGYLHYRQRDKWNDMVADGVIEISTMCAQDTEVLLSLWAFALDVDLFPHVSYWNGPVDDPLAYTVNNARAVSRTINDGLYVRILDVAAALQARTYEVDGQITFQLDDDMGYAAGTYQLTVSNGQGTVAKTESDAEVSLAVRDLGALYLGRACAALYASTGRITGDAAGISRLGQLFVTERAPWCPEMF